MRIIKTIIFILAIFTASSYAQDVTTVEAKTEDISKNLDLEAVASVFGESKDLEDFEKKLNDPEAQITNLDVNDDGLVDYLRVMETVKDDTHYVAIQAVVGENEYQDVASIEVEKDEEGETTVQVVGDVYMYGTNYIVQPVYVSPPVIYVTFWGPMYHPYHSPWYWHYHPPYYHPWHPHPHHHYHSHVRVHVNVHNSYHRTNVRISSNSVHIQNTTRKNDYGSKNKNQSFENRNKGVGNASQLNKSTPANTANKNKTGNKVDNNWEPKSGNSKNDVKSKQPDWSKNNKEGSSANKKDKSNVGNQQKPKTNNYKKPSTQTRPSHPVSRPRPQGRRR